MRPFDVAVIGGGIAGCSAALHLRQRGASVVLLERGQCGTQASGVNYGGVRQQGRHEAELPLSQRSRAIWARLPELVDSDCEFVVTGHIKLARSDRDMAELEAYAHKAAAHGVTLELIGNKKLRDRYPWLGMSVVGGSFCADDGQANPRLVTPALARAARAMGANIRQSSAVVNAVHRGNGFELLLDSGGTVRSRALINSAGAWGATIAAMFGEDVPEEVMAPNMCVTGPVPYFIEPNLGVVGGDIYIRQIPRGNVIFGSGLGEADRAAIRAFPSPDVTTDAARLAVALVPRLAHAQLIRTWSGIEGRMPDGLPVLGLSSTTPGLVHGFGFSGHGFQLGLAVGAVLAELALDGEPKTPIGEFAIARFLDRQSTRPNGTKPIPSKAIEEAKHA
ncbi:FAD-dependent oxidoreductase [Mesorhizobium sp. M00.F.Ca.ET.216.01.1.1]|uniref:NAD(P)/FAD-dependent oxidoreductase n=1 Tax=Mesorhizobium sp. M00.F.Ca.ET.216.01.1.1 TaxID=2500528 RepID=UPI000FD84A59|nr:FAD-dependent oxidoreductase [Mesorhizobium sp. M00.F.Ca.ET.216.01.1.1]TGQ35813.1 FAD-binding oxidoreductase [Mesorhizobium sp. M00.F.Ca.ET.216.01.1.1]